MTGSGKRQDGARGRALIGALGPVGLALLLGGCMAGLSATHSSLESALYSAPHEIRASGDPADDRGAAQLRPRPPDAATRIALITTSSTPAPLSRAEDLTRAMSERLSAMGYRLVLPPPTLAPGEDLYFVTARFAIEPGNDGDKVGIDWLVSDALGNPIGKVSQARSLAAHPTPEQWQSEALLATAAAAEGIARIVTVRP